MSTLNPSDFDQDAQQGSFPSDIFQPNNAFETESLELFEGSESVSMGTSDTFENNVLLAPQNGIEKSEQNNMSIDNERKNVSALNSEVNSPRETVSPTGSSPFSAMESDGEGIETGQEDANLSCAGDQSYSMANGHYGTSTPLTTPCASSSCCDDDYESTGSRKKRRKLRRQMHHPAFHHAATTPSLQLGKPANPDSWQHDNDTSPFSPPTRTKEMNFNFSANNGRRTSGAALSTTQDDNDNDDDEFSHENAKRTRKCEDEGGDNMAVMNVKTEAPNAMDTASALSSTHRASSTMLRNAPTGDEEQILHKQYPRKYELCELRIVTQPESQHRARYLTEGSRGPVKDSTQQGFPKIQLTGYGKAVTLQVFVATDSGKVRPHGFYQACKVTGRNTSACEEREIEGTKVIEIPFKPQDGTMVLNVDCVGILKLRNTDVEVRTGMRNQKRNQSVRLVFRVAFTAPSGNAIVLQVASSRISCTQPLGQPEITKKSIDRCSVEGGTEMFIIGKNFHRGTKVIYQDPEEPNGTQWSAEGEVEKDTFHQSHMVVRVPPYHDQEIVKPVNVQLIVEFQDKKCEPHSFTYTPKEQKPPKDEPKKTAPATTGSNIESALSLITGADKKLLVALFSKLLDGGIASHADSASGYSTPDPVKSEPPTQPPLNSSAVGDHQSLLNVVLQNQAIPAQPAAVASKQAVDVVIPSTASAPNTIYASPPIQSALPTAPQPVINVPHLGVPSFTVQPGQLSNPTPQTNNVFTGVDPAKIIKSELSNQDTIPSFCVTTAVQPSPMVLSTVSQVSTLGTGVGNLGVHPVSQNPVVLSQTIAPHAGIVGQTYQSVAPQTIVFNSFVPANSVACAPVSSVSAVDSTVSHQATTSEGDATVSDFIGQNLFNGGYVQQPAKVTAAAMSSAGSNQSHTPQNFQLQGFKVTPALPNAFTSMASVTSLPSNNCPTPAVIPASSQVQFQQPLASQASSTAVNFQNNHSATRPNVLQQPTFTFQNSFVKPANVAGVTNLQNQSTEQPMVTNQVVNPVQQPFAEKVRFTIGANEQTANSQPSQSSFTIPATIVHCNNQPFVVSTQHQNGFTQPQHFSVPGQVVSSTGVQQSGNQLFQKQTTQIQPSSNQGSSQGHVQTQSHTDSNTDNQMLVDPFTGPQNVLQIHGDTESLIAPMNVQTVNQMPNVASVQPMEDVSTSTLNTNQQNAVAQPHDQQMKEITHGQLLQQQSVQIAPDVRPQSADTGTTSSAIVPDIQQMHQGMSVNPHSFQTTPTANASIGHDPSISVKNFPTNQDGELNQPGHPAQISQSFQLQNVTAAILHEVPESGSNFSANPMANIGNSGNSQQQNSSPGESFHDVTITFGNSSALGSQNFQTFQQSQQTTGSAIPHEAPLVSSNFQANPSSNRENMPGNFQVNSNSPVTQETPMNVSNFRTDPGSNVVHDVSLTAADFHSNPNSNLADSQIQVSIIQTSPPPQIFQSPPRHDDSSAIQNLHLQGQPSAQTTQATVVSGILNPNQQQPVNNPPPMNLNHEFSYETDHNVGLQQANHGDMQNTTALHQQQEPGSCINNAANRPMVPAPDIYAMTQLLQSIDGSESLVTISGEDVQRHCQ